MEIKEIIPGLIRITLFVPYPGFEEFINAWLINDNKRNRTVLVETGPTVSAVPLVEDIRSLGIGRIDYLLYTHIHIDHAGGAGKFSKIHPETKFIVPAKGRAHLINPEKLIIGSRENLGALCDIYGMPEPLNAAAFAPPDLDLDGLSVIDTPGHSPHHSSYVYDLDGTKILFAGEAAGCYFKLNDGSVFMHPATPHKFYYETAMESIDRLIRLKDTDIICYPHFGCSRDVNGELASAKKQMALWMDIISAMPEGSKAEEAVEALLKSDPMLQNRNGLDSEERDRDYFFLCQSADGYLGYINRKNAHWETTNVFNN